MTINAGIIPASHWVHDPERGGGRIIGEACHFIDLMAFLAGSRVEAVSAFMIGRGPAVRDDKVAMTLLFADGSLGTLSYYANGSKAYPKEQIEVFSDGRVLRLNNFQSLEGYGVKGFRQFKTLRQEKGHAAEVAAFVGRLSAGGGPLIPLEESVNATLASFAAVISSHEQRVVRVDELVDQLNR